MGCCGGELERGGGKVGVGWGGESKPCQPGLMLGPTIRMRK